MKKIKDYEEKEIRGKILTKIKSVNPKNRVINGDHDKLWIYAEGAYVTKVKLPNEHSRVMHHSKSKYIAQQLRLDSFQFCELIDCTMSGFEYYRLLLKK